MCFDPRMVASRNMPGLQCVEIDAFEDPRLVDYQNLKDATLAIKRGRFIVEGRGVLEVLLERSAFRPDSILLSERTARSMAGRLEELAPECPVYIATQSVMDSVVGFPIHRGCLASCRRPPQEDPLLLAKRLLEDGPAPRILILERIRNLDNVGGIFRNAMALGGRGVILCPESCDPLYRKAIRTSMGGSLCLPFARATDWPGDLQRLRGLGFEILALDPGDGGAALHRLAVEDRGPVALLVGTEGEGLSEGALAAADQRVRIEMEDGVDSLNVAMAAGIALHALREHGPIENPSATLGTSLNRSRGANEIG